MALDLVPKDHDLPSFTNRSLVSGEHVLERFARDRNVTDIMREAAKHLAAEQMQAAKTVLAVDLTNSMYEHALTGAEALKSRAYELLEKDGRSADAQADYESLHHALMARYNGHINGIVEVGVTGVARELHREVLSPSPEQRGLFR
jgi:hypothetical protein